MADAMLLDNRTVPWGYDPADFGAGDVPDAAPQQVVDEQARRQQEMAAQATLRAMAAAHFSYAEQRELIGEGGRDVRARTLGDLQIEGTHYAGIRDDDPVDGDDEFLLL